MLFYNQIIMKVLLCREECTKMNERSYSNVLQALNVNCPITIDAVLQPKNNESIFAWCFFHRQHNFTHIDRQHVKFKLV